MSSRVIPIATKNVPIGSKIELLLVDYFNDRSHPFRIKDWPLNAFFLP